MKTKKHDIHCVYVKTSTYVLKFNFTNYLEELK